MRTCGACRFYLYGECHVDPPAVMLLGNIVKSVRPCVEFASLACARYGSKSGEVGVRSDWSSFVELLGTRSRNVLDRAEVDSFDSLAAMADRLRCFRGCGVATLGEIKVALDRCGLSDGGRFNFL